MEEITPRELRDRLWRELADLEELTGGPWTQERSRGPSRCDDDTYYYDAAGRYKGEHTDFLAMADQIADYWRGLGFTPERISYLDDQVIYEITTPWGDILSTTVNGPWIEITGETRCLAADWDRQRAEDLREYGTGRPTPSTDPDPNRGAG
ncbi:hypothetical protein [Mycetocola spongiae]|uniref:hypothetical protein n=1 Tax=Mycetocola spongiae TaxID=2859226 RepID=UPI001CF25C8B|nr:hypothetical protein [Mycetocola spongiae]UCR87995.1 hypothetical protein KXZ72_08220 [Mycetocola spongiae]